MAVKVSVSVYVPARIALSRSVIVRLIASRGSVFAVNFHTSLLRVYVALVVSFFSLWPLAEVTATLTSLPFSMAHADKPISPIF